MCTCLETLDHPFFMLESCCGHPVLDELRDAARSCHVPFATEKSSDHNMPQIGPRHPAWPYDCVQRLGDGVQNGKHDDSRTQSFNCCSAGCSSMPLEGQWKPVKAIRRKRMARPGDASPGKSQPLGRMDYDGVALLIWADFLLTEYRRMQVCVDITASIMEFAETAIDSCLSRAV